MPIHYLSATDKFINNTPKIAQGIATIAARESQNWGSGIPHSFGKPRNFQRVAVPGDGSCLFHSTAVGILDLIYEGKVKHLLAGSGDKVFLASLAKEIFDPATQRQILEKLRQDSAREPMLKSKVEEMRKLFKDFEGNPLGLIQHLEISVAKLKDSGKNSAETQAEIAMWMHMLTAGFRKVRTKQLAIESPTDLHLINPPQYGHNIDAIWLGRKFGVAVTAYTETADKTLELISSRSQAVTAQDSSGNATLIGEGSLPPNAPSFAIIHRWQHYEYLCDMDRNNKLISRLPDPMRTANLSINEQRKEADEADRATELAFKAAGNIRPKSQTTPADLRKAVGKVQVLLNSVLEKVNNNRSESPLKASIIGEGKNLEIVISFNQNDLQEFAFIHELMKEHHIKEFFMVPPNPAVGQWGRIVLPAASIDAFGVKHVEDGVNEFLKKYSERLSRTADLKKLYDNLNSFNISPQQYQGLSRDNKVSGFKVVPSEGGAGKEFLVRFQDKITLKALQDTLKDKKIRFYYEPGNDYLIIRDQLFEDKFSPDLKMNYEQYLKKEASRVREMFGKTDLEKTKKNIRDSWNSAYLALSFGTLTGAVNSTTKKWENGKISIQEWEEIIKKHGSNFTPGKEKEQYEAFKADIAYLLSANSNFRDLFSKFTSPFTFLASLDPTKQKIVPGTPSTPPAAPKTTAAFTPIAVGTVPTIAPNLQTAATLQAEALAKEAAKVAHATAQAAQVHAQTQAQIAAISGTIGGFSSYSGLQGKIGGFGAGAIQGVLAKQLIRQLDGAPGWYTSEVTTLNKPLSEQVGPNAPPVTIGASQIASEDSDPNSTINKEISGGFKKAFGDTTVTLSKATVQKLSDSAKIVTNSKNFPRELFIKIQKELIANIEPQEKRTLKKVLKAKGGDALIIEWTSQWQSLGFTSQADFIKALDTPMLLLASNICHSQEIHFFVEQQLRANDNAALNKLRTGNLDNATPNVLLSIPGINVAYSGLKPDEQTRGLVSNMWESLLDSAVLQNCRNLATPAIGLGAFAGIYGTEMAKIYYETLSELLSSDKYKGKFDNVFVNTRGKRDFSPEFDAIFKPGGTTGGCNVQNFKKDVKFLAIELAKAGHRCALVNPSDADVVLGKNDVGEYFKHGDYVAEEDFAATSTAVVGSKGICDVYTNAAKIFATAKPALGLTIATSVPPKPVVPVVAPVSTLVATTSPVSKALTGEDMAIFYQFLKTYLILKPNDIQYSEDSSSLYFKINANDMDILEQRFKGINIPVTFADKYGNKILNIKTSDLNAVLDKIDEQEKLVSVQKGMQKPVRAELLEQAKDAENVKNKMEAYEKELNKLLGLQENFKWGFRMTGYSKGATGSAGVAYGDLKEMASSVMTKEQAVVIRDKLKEIFPTLKEGQGILNEGEGLLMATPQQMIGPQVQPNAAPQAIYINIEELEKAKFANIISQMKKASLAAAAIPAPPSPPTTTKATTPTTPTAPTPPTAPPTATAGAVPPKPAVTTTPPAPAKFEVFDMTKRASTTGWFNNCGLNCFSHFLIDKLVHGTDTDRQVFTKRDPVIDTSLLASFREYYHLQNLKPEFGLADLQKMFTTAYTDPIKQEMIMAPVLRIHLAKKILLKDANTIKARASTAWNPPNVGKEGNVGQGVLGVEANFSDFIRYGVRGKSFEEPIVRANYDELSKLHVKYIEEMSKHPVQPTNIELQAAYAKILKDNGYINRLLDGGIVLTPDSDYTKLTKQEKDKITALLLPQKYDSHIFELRHQTPQPEILNYLKLPKTNPADPDKYMSYADFKKMKHPPGTEALFTEFEQGIMRAGTKLIDDYVMDQVYKTRSDKVLKDCLVDAKQMWENGGESSGYVKYANYMRELQNSAMYTNSELGELAKEFGMGIAVYTSNQIDGTPVFDESGSNPAWKIKMFNSGLHWEYEEASVAKAVAHNQGYHGTPMATIYPEAQDRESVAIIQGEVRRVAENIGTPTSKTSLNYENDFQAKLALRQSMKFLPDQDKAQQRAQKLLTNQQLTSKNGIQLAAEMERVVNLQSIELAMAKTFSDIQRLLPELLNNPPKELKEIKERHEGRLKQYEEYLAQIVKISSPPAGPAVTTSPGANKITPPITHPKMVTDPADLSAATRPKVPPKAPTRSPPPPPSPTVPPKVVSGPADTAQAATFAKAVGQRESMTQNAGALKSSQAAALAASNIPSSPKLIRSKGLHVEGTGPLSALTNIVATTPVGGQMLYDALHDESVRVFQQKRQDPTPNVKALYKGVDGVESTSSQFSINQKPKDFTITVDKPQGKSIIHRSYDGINALAKVTVDNPQDDAIRIFAQTHKCFAEPPRPPYSMNACGNAEQAVRVVEIFKEEGVPFALHANDVALIQAATTDPAIKARYDAIVKPDTAPKLTST